MNKNPHLMAILNVTPDSFFEESRAFAPAAAIDRGLQFIDLGADILDIGGESTRPGAAEVSEEEEIERVMPIVQALSSKIAVSIDTRKAKVAAKAVEAGAKWINDITGFEASEMRDVAASSGVKICVMHMQGEPKTMQVNPYYKNGVVHDLMTWFEERVHLLVKSGIKKENIVLDPGIGFGKTVADNLEIIHNLARFRALGFPLLIGLSRKSFMSKILNKPAQELLAATIAMNALVLPHVDVIRVHDVKEHRDVIDVMFPNLNG